MSAVRHTQKNDFLSRILSDTSAKVSASIDAWTNPTPPRMMVNAPDLWGGNIEAGRMLVSGYFVIGSQQWRAPQGDAWTCNDVPPLWQDHILAFDFLADLHAYGMDAARREARHHIAQYIMRPTLLRQDNGRLSDLAAKRLINWLTHYEFFAASAMYEFQLEVRRSLGAQLRGLMKVDSAPGLPTIRQAVAVAMGGLCIEGFESSYTLAKVWLQSSLSDFIQHHGVATRSASDALETLTLLTTLRCTILQSGHSVPEFLLKAIGDLVACVRFMRGPDRKLPLFQGGKSCSIDTIDKVLKRADVRARAVSGAMGYQKLAVGRTQILMDCGALPAVEHDENAHAAPLAIEMWIGKERLFTQCGNSPFIPDAGQLSLRGTSAHSTVCVDERNVCEIRSVGGLGRRYAAPTFQRWDLEDGAMIEAVHQGYQSLYGMAHKRKLALLDDGDYLAGEDEIISDTELLRPHYVTLRFHLHPRVSASLIQNDTEVLLRMPNGQGWRFIGDGARIDLEESIYCGSGFPRMTYCITMTREMTVPHISVPWAVQAELPS